MKLTTTLNKIRAHRPCAEGWKTLCTALGSDYDEDAEINLLTILESNGVQDMLWCLRATVEDSDGAARQLAIAFAEDVLSIFEKAYPGDMRPRKAIQAARDFAEGKIGIAELREKQEAARAAADAAAYAAARAAYAAADATADAAAYAAAYAARIIARSRQIEIIITLLS